MSFARQAFTLVQLYYAGSRRLIASSEDRLVRHKFIAATNYAAEERGRECDIATCRRHRVFRAAALSRPRRSSAGGRHVVVDHSRGQSLPSETADRRAQRSRRMRHRVRTADRAPTIDLFARSTRLSRGANETESARERDVECARAHMHDPGRVATATAPADRQRSRQCECDARHAAKT